MPEIYSWPAQNETLGINQIAGYVSNVTSGLFFPGVMWAMFVIILITTLNFGKGNAFVYTSFFTSIIAIFFVVAGFMNPNWMYFMFVLLGISLLLKRLDKSSTLPQI